MSTPERLKGWFQFLWGAIVLIGMLVLVRAFLPGLGGCLGLAAFASVAMLPTIIRPINRRRPNRSGVLRFATCRSFWLR